ncbi:NADH:ubiquinone reductase (Na(+)-transporting) subunit C [bacterium]|nr:NADH:ubiquinone reductase (Na(+)-transporting) subunit C [bacterium]
MQRSNLYTIIFVLIIAATLSALLSLASFALKERQQLVREADMMRNILQAVGIMECPLDPKDKLREMDGKECSDVHCCYKQYIQSSVIDYRGNPVKKKEIIPERIDLEKEMSKALEKRLYPVFIRKRDGKVISYCIPVYGKGLWSSIYGFLALKSDLNTVEGVTFYKHGETPGLGAEIQSARFQNSFIGKRIFDNKGRLVSITVVKGKIDPDSPRAMHQVDGISGATQTTKGVTKLLMKSLEIYEPYMALQQKVNN